MDLQPLLEDAIQYIQNYAWNILGALLIFVIGRWVAKKLITFLKTILRRQHVDETLVKFLDNISYYALMVVVLMAVADRLGINTSSFLAIFGAAGLAVGLALKDSLGNFASGVMLVFFRPFKIGDVVNAGGITGKVEVINMFNTVFLTPDNQRMIVPNGQITNDVITNITANPTRRLDLIFGIAYEDDVRTARKVFETLLANEPRILADPAPMIVVGELADSSVNIYVRPWVKTEDYWDVKWALTEAGKIALDEAGITIPFPQRDVHVYKQDS